MVGLVLVSHSATVAEGAAELARQMGGEDVAIEPAGGLDLPDRPIGTDAVLVLAAIERAWSGDGVLVLMDLGSALLSAEMAVEMLDDDRRGRVRLTSAPFVEGAVAAAVAARLGRSLDEVTAEALGGLGPKIDHLGDHAAASTAGVPEAAVDGEPESTMRIVVSNRLGLHARPAARFVTTASGFDARVRVRDLTNGRGPADARSMNAVATLGVAQGHEIEVGASGPGAAAALDAIRALAEANFGDADEPETAPAPPPPTARAAARVDGGDPSLLVGIAASPGIALGPVRRLIHRRAAEPPSPGTPAEERARFDAAVASVSADIRATRGAVASRAGEPAAEIFDAHLLLLNDDELLDPARRAIAEGASAADAWRSAIAAAAGRWRDLDDPYLRSRGDDVEAIGEQVLDALAGGGGVRPPGAGVLVADDVTPAQTASLDLDEVSALLTARGGPTSHAAVLARSLGLPAVVALGDRVLGVAEGTDVVVDGGAGTVRVDPGERERTDARERAQAARASEAEARSAATAPATTLDGTTVPVFANVGRP
ncbi:MAG: dihydroxyacetone kinase phosphoryl donor subunit DhaM, partial [Actinomycetota bacterium]